MCKEVRRSGSWLCRDLESQRSVIEIIEWLAQKARAPCWARDGVSRDSARCAHCALLPTQHTRPRHTLHPPPR